MAESRELGRQLAADPGAIAPAADLFQRPGEEVQRPQYAPDKHIDEQNREAAEHGRRHQAFGKLVPDFAGLVIGVRFDHDHPVIAITDDNERASALRLQICGSRRDPPALRGRQR